MKTIGEFLKSTPIYIKPDFPKEQLDLPLPCHILVRDMGLKVTDIEKYGITSGTLLFTAINRDTLMTFVPRLPFLMNERERALSHEKYGDRSKDTGRKFTVTIEDLFSKYPDKMIFGMSYTIMKCRPLASSG